MKRWNMGLLCLASLVLAFSACQSNPEVVKRGGTQSIRENAVETTARAYCRSTPSTLQEMQAMLCSAPISTHSDAKGDYAHWASCEVDRKGGRYVSSAGCLSRDGKIVSSFLLYKDAFVKRSKAQVHLHGDSSLLDEAAHPGMAVAVGKSFRALGYNPLSHRGMEMPGKAGAAPSDAVVASPAPEQKSGGETSAFKAPPGYVLVPISSLSHQVEQPVQQQPVRQPVQQQNNNGEVIVNTMNNIFGIVQKFL